jgi:hypothetical protein
LGGAIYGARIATIVKQKSKENPITAVGFLKIRCSVNLNSRILGCGWFITGTRYYYFLLVLVWFTANFKFYESHQASFSKI